MGKPATKRILIFWLSKKVSARREGQRYPAVERTVPEFARPETIGGSLVYGLGKTASDFLSQVIVMHGSRLCAMRAKILHKSRAEPNEVARLVPQERHARKEEAEDNGECARDHKLLGTFKHVLVRLLERVQLIDDSLQRRRRLQAHLPSASVSENLSAIPCPPTATTKESCT
eukprot:1190333-Pleurochrysis_carterae.AAC.2